MLISLKIKFTLKSHIYKQRFLRRFVVFTAVENVIKLDNRDLFIQNAVKADIKKRNKSYLNF